MIQWLRKRLHIESVAVLQIRALERFRDDCAKAMPARTAYEQAFCVGGIQRAEELIAHLQETT